MGFGNSTKGKVLTLKASSWHTISVIRCTSSLTDVTLYLRTVRRTPTFNLCYRDPRLVDGDIDKDGYPASGHQVPTHHDLDLMSESRMNDGASESSPY
jgi:hypothetical protein